MTNLQDIFYMPCYTGGIKCAQKMCTLLMWIKHKNPGRESMPNLWFCKETFSVIIILTLKSIIYSNAKRYTTLKSLCLLTVLGGQSFLPPVPAMQLFCSLRAFTTNEVSHSWWVVCLLMSLRSGHRRHPGMISCHPISNKPSRLPSEQMWLIISTYANASNYFEIVVVSRLF